MHCRKALTLIRPTHQTTSPCRPDKAVRRHPAEEATMQCRMALTLIRPTHQTTSPCTPLSGRKKPLQLQNIFHKRNGEFALGGDRGAIQLIERVKQRAHLAI